VRHPHPLAMIAVWKSRWNWVGAWVGLFLLTLGVCWAAFVSDAYELYRNGVPGQAVVTGKGPHRTVLYTFQYRGRTYAGASLPAVTGKRFEDFHAGETVDIYFDPARPQMSGLGDRTENFREIFASVLVSSSFIASLGTLLLYLRRRRAR
jgi:hypothetical protein